MREMNGLKVVFRALSHRNYRLFFGGQGISLVGTWMQQIAMSWLVYRLTGSAVLLGLVGFTSRIPTFLLSPFAGVLADRWDRHRILVITQTLSMLQAMMLAILVLTGRVAVWHVVALSLFLGFINSVDVPARQSFVVDMIERREDLGNAIALNSSIVNGARLVGPSVAGILIAALGEGLCFLLNGLSFIAVIVALLAMKIRPREKEVKRSHVIEGLKEGLSYGFGSAPIRSVLLLLALVSLMGVPYTVLMPIFAEKVFHRGPEALGFLLGATGVGALTGSIYLASRKSVLGLGRVIVISAGVFGMGLIGFSLSRVFWLSLCFMLLTGSGMMVQMASSNTNSADDCGGGQTGTGHEFLHDVLYGHGAFRKPSRRQLRPYHRSPEDGHARWDRLYPGLDMVCEETPGVAEGHTADLCGKGNHQPSAHRSRITLHNQSKIDSSPQRHRGHRVDYFFVCREVPTNKKDSCLCKIRILLRLRVPLGCR